MVASVNLQGSFGVGGMQADIRLVLDLNWGQSQQCGQPVGVLGRRPGMSEMKIFEALVPQKFKKIHHSSCLSVAMPFCKVIWLLLPSQNRMSFLSPWIWAGLVACFGPENVIEGEGWHFWVWAPGPCILPCPLRMLPPGEQAQDSVLGVRNHRPEKPAPRQPAASTLLATLWWTAHT